MSQENVDLARDLVARWLSGDETWLADVHPEVELDISGHPIPDFPNEGLGKEHLIQFLVTYVSGFRDYRLALTDVTDAGDEVVLVFEETVGVLDSDATVDRELAHVWSFTSGKLKRMRAFRRTSEALEAVGPGE